MYQFSVLFLLRAIALSKPFPPHPLLIIVIELALLDSSPILFMTSLYPQIVFVTILETSVKVSLLTIPHKVGVQLAEDSGRDQRTGFRSGRRDIVQSPG